MHYALCTVRALLSDIFKFQIFYPLLVLKIPVNGIFEACIQSHRRFPIEKLFCLTDVGPGFFYICFMKGFLIYYSFLPQEVFDLA